MGTRDSGGGTPSAPKQVESVMDVQQQDDKIAQIIQSSRSNLPSWMNPPSVDAAVSSSLRKSTSDYAQKQYQQLASDLETQSAPGFSGHNYSAYTATQLKQMVSTNMDPTTAGDGASAWNKIGNNYVTVAQDLNQATGASEYGWQGMAADSTRDFINGVGTWAGTAGQGAQLAGNRLAVQSEAASAAKNSMPTNPTEPPTAADISANMLQGGLNPAIGAVRLNAQFQQAAADHAEAVQAAQTYDTSLASSGEKFPAFSPPPTFDSNSGGGASLPSSGGGGVSGLNASRNTPTANAGVRGGSSSAGARGSGSGGTGLQAPPVTSPSGPGTPNLSTGQSGFESGTTPPPSTTNPGSGTGVNVPSQGSGWNSGGNADPTFSGSLLNELGAEGGAGFGGGGAGFGAGGAGLGAGGAGGAGGVLRGLSGGSGSAAGGEGGTGPRSGVGAAAAAEEAEGGVRGGAAGESSEPGMMPRGGQGRRGEDSEHKRPDYLLNPDPDATFGPDVYVAPPVIGE